jgi:hypothetical protein
VSFPQRIVAGFILVAGIALWIAAFAAQRLAVGEDIV